jgi:predicted nuclease of predicted toxin-antitoxin system
MLQQHGHESKHVADLNMMQTSDRDIWAWAKQSKSIIISKDDDFVFLHSADENPCAVCWIRVGNTRRKDLRNGLSDYYRSLKKNSQRGNCCWNLHKQWKERQSRTEYVSEV